VHYENVIMPLMVDILSLQSGPLIRSDAVLFCLRGIITGPIKFHRSC